MYCMDVASTIAKLPFSISTVTLRYGEDDMSDLYSCISMAVFLLQYIFGPMCIRYQFLKIMQKNVNVNVYKLAKTFA